MERLTRLCGLQLNVSLTPYDDSDIVQAEAILRLTPEERVRQLTRSVKCVRSLRSQARG